MTRYLHFFVNISIQFVFLMLAYYAALGFYQSYFDAALSAVPVYFSLLGMFLTVYFSLMWKDFYAHNVHSYLKITVSIITRNLLTAQLPVFMFILADIIFVNQFRLSPLKALIFFSFAGCTFLGMHGLYYLWLRSLSYHGYFHKKVMVVGQAGRRFHVEKFFQDMGDSKEFCGSLTVAHGVKHAESHSALWAWEDHDATPGKLEYYRSFMDIVYQHHIGELVIFLGPRLSEELLQNITRTCDEYAIGYYIVPDLSSLPQTKHWDNIFSYIPIVNHTTTNRDNLLNISIKRLFDMGTSLLILLLFLPFGLLIGLLIFLSDWGPVFYVSERVGKDGQIIPFFKFRTMHKNAEKMKAKLLALNERDGPLFKLKDDPRVTKVGHFLRRTSLDEFPQFVNVLLGHMSIIGPRPHLPEEVQSYVKKDFMRLECMPGIVCLPQLRDRDHIGFHEWVNFDLYYRKNWTLGLDFYIFWKTGLIFLKSFFFVDKD